MRSGRRRIRGLDRHALFVDLVDKLEELLAKLAAREEVDEEIDGEIAVGEKLDDG